MAAETQYTANTGIVTISTANSALDGTGTLGLVLTASGYGTLIKTITVKSRQATTTRGYKILLNLYFMKKISIVFTLFLISCSNNKLDQESNYEKPTVSKIRFKTFSIIRGDTLDGVDHNGLKQGKWHESKYKVLNKLNGPDLIITSTGYYKDNKKIGNWINYDDYGNIIDTTKY